MRTLLAALGVLFVGSVFAAACHCGGNDTPDDAEVSNPPDAEVAPDVGSSEDASEPADAEVEAPDAEAGAPDAGAGEADGGATCSLGTAASFATDQSLDLFGQVVYFNGGADLPAGPYRVTYVDGCMKYGGGQGWTIHAYADGSDAWWLVGATSADKVVMPPGTVGWAIGAGAYENFDDCVAANLALPPLDFTFAGGPLGVWLQDSPYSDNLSGVDGRNPKWSLTSLAPCGDAGTGN